MHPKSCRTPATLTLLGPSQGPVYPVTRTAHQDQAVSSLQIETPMDHPDTHTLTHISHSDTKYRKGRQILWMLSQAQGEMFSQHLLVCHFEQSRFPTTAFGKDLYNIKAFCSSLLHGKSQFNAAT